MAATSHERLLVMGFGITGQALVEFARQHGQSVFVSDSGTLSKSQQCWLSDRGVPFEHHGHSTRFLDDVDLIVLSPGVPLQLEVLTEAACRGLPIQSELDYACGKLGLDTVIAVTGTNGKSTTVQFIGAILQSVGRRAWVAGNIGLPLISIVDQVAPTDSVVLEVSSYQLEQSVVFRPHVGVLLNLTPDHLKRHGSFDAYANAKGRLFVRQDTRDVAILPQALMERFAQGRARRLSLEDVMGALPSPVVRLMPHERENLAAALAACSVVAPSLDADELPWSAILATARLPHRMQDLGFVRDVRLINDSKSTNAASAIAAVQATSESMVLLLGGRSKGGGYEALFKAIAKRPVRAVIVFGEAATELMDVARRTSSVDQSPTLIAERSLETAVVRGLSLAQPGDALLLSPACASFDAFTSFERRGDAFSNLVRSQPGYRPPTRT